MARKLGYLLAILVLALIVLFLTRQAQQTIGSPKPDALTSPPDFTGWVMEVEPGSSQIKVESQADKIVRRVTVKLTKDTPIFRREGDVLKQVDISDVHLQDQAELWLIGPVPDALPAEVNIRQMIIEKLY